MDTTSNPKVNQCALKKNFHMDDLCFTDLSNSNSCHQELSQADDKQRFPTNLQPSSTRGFETVPETFANEYDDVAKTTQDSLLQLPMGITERLHKEAAREMESVPTGNSIIYSEEISDFKLFPEETRANERFLPQKAGLLENSQFSSNTSEFKDTRKSSCFTSDSYLGQTILDGIKDVSNEDHVALESSAYSLEFPNTSKSMEIPDFHNVEKNMQEGKPGDFFYPWSKTNSDGRATTIAREPCTSTFDSYPVSSVINSSTEKYKPSNEALKPSVIQNTDSNVPLSEMLSILENWARRGLDKVFNTPGKVCSIDIETNFEMDLDYGMGVMKEMTMRIYTLMRAVNQLPDPDTSLLPGFERERNPIRGDLIDNGINMWHTIDDMELQISHDYKNLKSVIIRGKNTDVVNSTEQEADPNILITNAYTLVSEKLQLLRTQMEDFREKIRAFCSEIDKLL